MLRRGSTCAFALAAALTATMGGAQASAQHGVRVLPHERTMASVVATYLCRVTHTHIFNRGHLAGPIPPCSITSQ